MNNRLLAAALLGLVACVTPTKKIEASSTLEDLPNEPVDAGAPTEVAAAKPDAAKPKDDTPPPSLTFVRADATEGFSVLLPKDPQVQRNTVPLKAGNVTTVALFSNVDGAIYSASRSDYPEAIVKKKGAKRMLGEVLTGLSNQFKGPVSDELDAELAGHPGQTFTVAVVYTGKVPEKADEFFSSLELKNPPPAPKK
jgi:hypothetical protein